jgi:hypothetical protein
VLGGKPSTSKVMHDETASTGKSRKPRALAAAAAATAITTIVVGMKVSGEARRRPVHSSGVSSSDDRQESPTVRPVPPSVRRLVPQPELEVDVTRVDSTSDGSSATLSVPAWVDAGPWQFDDLATFWEDERHDPEWSANVKEYIYAMLEPEDLNLDVLSRVDCRETLCRVEMNASHIPALSRLRATASGGGPPRFARKFVNADSGAHVVIVYIARDDLAERVFPSEAPGRDARGS